MIDLLTYEFIQHAILAAILVSIACGIIGTYDTSLHSAGSRRGFGAVYYLRV